MTATVATNLVRFGMTLAGVLGLMLLAIFMRLDLILGAVALSALVCLSTSRLSFRPGHARQDPVFDLDEDIVRLLTQMQPDIPAEQMRARLRRNETLETKLLVHSALVSVKIAAAETQCRRIIERFTRDERLGPGELAGARAS